MALKQLDDHGHGLILAGHGHLGEFVAGMPKDLGSRVSRRIQPSRTQETSAGPKGVSSSKPPAPCTPAALRTPVKDRASAMSGTNPAVVHRKAGGWGEPDLKGGPMRLNRVRAPNSFRMGMMR